MKDIRAAYWGVVGLAFSLILWALFLSACWPVTQQPTYIVGGTDSEVGCINDCLEPMVNLER